MLKRKTLSRVGIIFAILASLMLFVVPFFIDKLIPDTTLYVGIYICLLLVFIVVGNIAFEKSSEPTTLEEDREEKIKKIIGK